MGVSPPSFQCPQLFSIPPILDSIHVECRPIHDPQPWEIVQRYSANRLTYRDRFHVDPVTLTWN